MNLLVFLSIFSITIFSVLGQPPSIICNYAFTADNEYRCNIGIFNPNGLNNFTEVNGTHVAGMTSNDVKSIVLNGILRVTLNFPSIICQTLRNAHTIDFEAAGIERLGNDSFSNCTKLRVLILLRNRFNKLDEHLFINNHNLTYLELWDNQITELPENIFVNQHQLTYLSLNANNISDFPDNTFKPLKNLESLGIASTRITKLKHSWFEPLENLQMLYIYNNAIEELPDGIFATLKKIGFISAFLLKLKVIHSSSFGYLPKLTHIVLHDNQIDGFDERLVDNTAVTNLYMQRNICANDTIIDSSPSRVTLRIIMRTCFEKYRISVNESTTTTSMISSTTSQTPPPGCIIGNLDNRVCRLEDQFEELDENFQSESSRLSSVTDKLIAEIDVLRREKIEMQQNMAVALDNLQEQIIELANRPCACK